ncbi:MAG: PAQR family membrane homeostasis protein TrhA [Bacillota bacterium]
MQGINKKTMARECPAYTLGEELCNAISHGVGALLSIFALIAMTVVAVQTGTQLRIVCAVVYGATLFLLYSMSTLYHSLRGRAKRVMRIFDHCSIYLLIAGTYTPYTLIMLPQSVGITLLIGIWACAALGITLNIIDLERFRKFSIVCYVGMGWAVIFAIEPLVNALNPAGLWLMIGGGLAYMLGLVFYAWKRCRYMHSIWHFFVLAGSTLHFISILLYVLPS